VPSAYAHRVFVDGAVAYWRLGEISGTTAREEIGSFHGTISGAVTPNQPGALSDGNRAMTFNPAGAADGYITVPVGSYSAVGTGPATLEAWIRVRSIAPSVYLATAHLNATGLIAYVSTPSNLRVRCYGPASIVAEPNVSVPALLDGNWHHVVHVLRRGSPNDTIETWVDGTLMNSLTFATGVNFTSVNPTFIGASLAANEFLGDIDECALYKTALTPAQIANHYAAASQSGGVMPIRSFQLVLSGTPKRLSDVYGLGGEMANIPYRQLTFQVEGADAYLGDSTAVSTTNYGVKFPAAGSADPLGRLGPYEAGPLKLSDFYAVGAGATLHILGVPF
jgi:hypothetical protein